MRLVSGLRDEIDRRRAKAPVDSPASVRRILDRIGTPDEVVAGAGPRPRRSEAPRAAVPVQRDREEPPRKGRGLGRLVPRPRPAGGGDGQGGGPFAPFPSGAIPSRPISRGTRRARRQRETPTGGWRVVRPARRSRTMDSLPPGFVGGVEIPDLLKPAPRGRRGPPKPPRPPPKDTKRTPRTGRRTKPQAAPRRRPRLRLPPPLRPLEQPAAPPRRRVCSSREPSSATSTPSSSAGPSPTPRAG